VRVVVVGDGEQLPTLRSRVRRAGMESWVRTPGALSHHDLRSLYHDADIFVAPAAAESFGIAALEARASGLVVLAREGTGVGDFVSHGHTGLLAPDDARMADHLALLCGDPVLLDRMRTASRAVRPPFDWSDVLWRNEEAYAVAAGARVSAAPVVTGSQSA
jgi:glycosyltransferase involved in cell wall biosynthesis